MIYPDTYTRVEGWDAITGQWQVFETQGESPYSLARALASSNPDTIYRVVTTKIESIYEGGAEISPVDKLDHRACSF